MILNGQYRDTEAVLEGIDEKNFSASLTLESVSVLFIFPIVTQFVLVLPCHRSDIESGILSFLMYLICKLDYFVVPTTHLHFILCHPQGQHTGKRVDIAYEDFSKLA